MNKSINQSATPSEFEIQRVQILTIMACLEYHEEKLAESVSFFMREIELFVKNYYELIEEAKVCILGAKPRNKMIDNLILIASGFIAIDKSIQENNDTLFSAVIEMVQEIELSKEFSFEMRSHVINEISIRANWSEEIEVAS